MAMEPETRARVWMNWHIVAKSAERHFNYPPSQTIQPSVAICLLRVPERWDNTTWTAIRSIAAQRKAKTRAWSIIVLQRAATPGDTKFESDAKELLPELPLRMVIHKMDDTDILPLYTFAAQHSTADYTLLLDPVSWLHGDDAIDTMVRVAMRTNADLVTAQAYLNDTANATLLHIGSVGMYSSIVNCIGDWSIFSIKRLFPK